ncbi:hypothetical protein GCM10023086_13290 [Streptomyces venetus]|uniref:Uncharacterized protein n=1 Tax=Streptomyces venetus TaxID=1701086 RepID=A0ABP8FAM3_9ACTN
MSPNQKKALAVVVAFLSSVIVGFVCGLTVMALSEKPDAAMCVGTGAAAFLGVFVASVAVIALFEFSDSRPLPAPVPPGQVDHGNTGQTPPTAPSSGAPAA